MRHLSLLVFSCFILAGCSSSGLRSSVADEHLPMCLAPPLPFQPSIPHVSATQNTIMVHPGLLLLVDWGGQRALDVGHSLVEQGYAERILEVRSRMKAPMLEQMVKDGGGDYVGIHYSMGGAPKVLKAAVDAAAQVSSEHGVDTQYSAIMVDPFALGLLEKRINPDSAHLKQVFVILSNRYMPLRPDPSLLSSRVMQHPKFHFIFAEEYGVRWNHFTFLTDVKNDQRSTQNAQRGREIFEQVLQGAFGGLPSDVIASNLQHLRLRYARQDGRSLIPGLCRLDS